jgi:DNA-binding transcriptional MocR family regulator
MHLAAALPKGSRDRPISVRAARQGLWVMPLSMCYRGGDARQGLVLGYGGTTAAEMPAAVRGLGPCSPLREGVSPASTPMSA